jgi:hypothetical protein
VVTSAQPTGRCVATTRLDPIDHPPFDAWRDVDQDNCARIPVPGALHQVGSSGTVADEARLRQPPTTRSSGSGFHLLAWLDVGKAWSVSVTGAPLAHEAETMFRSRFVSEIASRSKVACRITPQDTRMHQVRDGPQTAP